MAPRLSRLASTISRDDNIMVIGAGDPPSSTSDDAPSSLLDVSLMVHLCQESRSLPSPAGVTVHNLLDTTRASFKEIVDIVIELFFTKSTTRTTRARQGPRREEKYDDDPAGS